MKSLIPLFILVASFPPLHAQVPDDSKYMNLDCSEFRYRYQTTKNAVLIDIRDYADFRKTRIKGAVNIPRSGGYEVAADTIEKGKALFIYCYSGVSSKKAALFFYDNGFREIYSLKGGMMRWRGEKMALDRKKLKKNSKRAT